MNGKRWIAIGGNSKRRWPEVVHRDRATLGERGATPQSEVLSQRDTDEVGLKFHGGDSPGPGQRLQ